MNICGFVTSSKHYGQHVRPCPTCGKETFHAFERRREWLTLFFLPVIPLSRGQGFTRCNLCGKETVEGGDRAALPGMEAGTKTCPECAELVRLEARLCRWCRYRFDEEEMAAARQFAEQTAADIAQQQHRQRLLRRARAYSVLGWILLLPGGLWSLLVGLLIIVLVAKEGPLKAHVLLAIPVWLVMSLPFFLGLLLRRKARIIRRRAAESPDRTEDSPGEAAGADDFWVGQNIWSPGANTE